LVIAYADPPYLGCCALYGHDHGDEGLCWDLQSTHALLIERLRCEFPDGWALSLHTPSLQPLLRFCPDDVRVAAWRVAAWVKPFAVFKPNVNPAYAWEPVIWRGGRAKRGRDEMTVRDWVSTPITLKKGLTGAKPELFAWWLFGLLGLRSDDELIDIFPGTGVVGRTWLAYQRQQTLFSDAAESVQERFQ
jgi:hypothetical protein